MVVLEPARRAGGVPVEPRPRSTRNALNPKKEPQADFTLLGVPRFRRAMGGIGGMGIARFAYGCQIILRRKNSTAALSQHHSYPAWRVRSVPADGQKMHAIDVEPFG